MHLIPDLQDIRNKQTNKNRTNPKLYLEINPNLSITDFKK